MNAIADLPTCSECGVTMQPSLGAYECTNCGSRTDCDHRGVSILDRAIDLVERVKKLREQQKHPN